MDTGPKRKVDKVTNTVVAVTIVIGATILGGLDRLSPEGVLTAYALAGAIGGVPIVVKRNGNDHR